MRAQRQTSKTGKMTTPRRLPNMAYVSDRRHDAARRHVASVTAPTRFESPSKMGRSAFADSPNDARKLISPVLEHMIRR